MRNKLTHKGIRFFLGCESGCKANTVCSGTVCSGAGLSYRPRPSLPSLLFAPLSFDATLIVLRCLVQNKAYLKAIGMANYASSNVLPTDRTVVQEQLREECRVESPCESLAKQHKGGRPQSLAIAGAA